MIWLNRRRVRCDLESGTGFKINQPEDARGTHGLLAGEVKGRR